MVTKLGCGQTVVSAVVSAAVTTMVIGSHWGQWMIEVGMPSSVSPHNSLGLCVVVSPSPCVQWLRPRDRCGWTRVSSGVIRGQLGQWRLENVSVSLQKRVKKIS